MSEKFRRTPRRRYRNRLQSANMRAVVASYLLGTARGTPASEAETVSFAPSRRVPEAERAVLHTFERYLSWNDKSFHICTIVKYFIKT